MGHLVSLKWMSNDGKGGGGGAKKVFVQPTMA